MSLTTPPVRLRVLPAILPIDGRDMEIRVTDTGIIQQRNAARPDGTQEAWRDVANKLDLTGPIGPETEFRSNGNYLQYRPRGAEASAWADFLPISTIIGPPPVLLEGETTTVPFGESAYAGLDPNEDGSYTLSLTLPAGPMGDVTPAALAAREQAVSAAVSGAQSSADAESERIAAAAERALAQTAAANSSAASRFFGSYQTLAAAEGAIAAIPEEHVVDVLDDGSSTGLYVKRGGVLVKISEATLPTLTRLLGTTGVGTFTAEAPGLQVAGFEYDPASGLAVPGVTFATTSENILEIVGTGHGVVAYIDASGVLHASGVGGGGGDTPTYEASLQRVEIASDPSQDMTLVWHAPNGSPAAVELRALGASSWFSAGASSRPMPGSTTSTIYWATVRNLSPETIYEWRAAGTGTAGVRKFRTLADYRKGDLRIAVVSDWQQGVANAMDAASTFNVISDNVARSGARIILLAGDYLSAGIQVTPAFTQTWEAFLHAFSSRFVDGDGCQIPIAAVAGNHEVAGDFSEPYCSVVFSTFYRPNASNTPGNGAGYFTVGKELLCVGLKYGHGMTPSEIAWLSDLLAARASQFRHVVVFTHMGPMAHTNSTWHIEPHALMRERLLPIIQQYPNCRFAVCGHNHNFAVTRRVKYVESPAGGVNAWFADPEGIVTLGTGGWGTFDYLPYDTQDQAADATLGDGSVLIEHLVASNQPVRGDVTPMSPPANNGNDPATKHHWLLDFEATRVVARGKALNDTDILTLTANIPTFGA